MLEGKNLRTYNFNPKNLLKKGNSCDFFMNQSRTERRKKWNNPRNAWPSGSQTHRCSRGKVMLRLYFIRGRIKSINFCSTGGQKDREQFSLTNHQELTWEGAKPAGARWKRIMLRWILFAGIIHILVLVDQLPARSPAICSRLQNKSEAGWTGVGADDHAMSDIRRGRENGERRRLAGECGWCGTSGT
jgi:hypothetical protein